MLVTEFLERIKPMAWLVFMLAFFGQVSVADLGSATGSSSGLWVLQPDQSESHRLATFLPTQDALKGQGVVMVGALPIEDPQTPLDASQVLAGLYRDLKDFRLVGTKATNWAGRPAHVVAFKATHQKHTVLGRALWSQDESSVQVLLLLSHPSAAKSFEKEFIKWQTYWNFDSPALANVNSLR